VEVCSGGKNCSTSVDAFHFRVTLPLRIAAVKEPATSLVLRETWY